MPKNDKVQKQNDDKGGKDEQDDIQDNEAKNPDAEEQNPETRLRVPKKQKEEGTKGPIEGRKYQPKEKAPDQDRAGRSRSRERSGQRERSRSRSKDRRVPRLKESEKKWHKREPFCYGFANDGVCKKEVCYHKHWIKTDATAWFIYNTTEELLNKEKERDALKEMRQKARDSEKQRNERDAKKFSEDGSTSSTGSGSKRKLHEDSYKGEERDSRGALVKLIFTKCLCTFSYTLRAHIGTKCTLEMCTSTKCTSRNIT